MNEVFTIIGELGAPIAGSLVMGFFIFLVIKQQDVVIVLCEN